MIELSVTGGRRSISKAETVGIVEASYSNGFSITETARINKVRLNTSIRWRQQYYF